MKQQCSMTFIYASWSILIAVLIYLVTVGDFVSAGVWLVVAPLSLWAYIRYFPSISRYIGYGRVDDQLPQEVNPAPAKVTLYTALGCPFCPIVKHRLAALQANMGFDLEEVDVTLKTDTLAARGIRAVPVVEVDGRRLVGNATSRQLADFIGGTASLI